MQKITGRNYFASLRYPAFGDEGQLTFGRRPVVTGHPVFTQSELASEPLKWLKYVLLGRLGLRPLEELAQDINRYPINRWRSAQARCKALLAKAHQRQLSTLIVVKLVPMDKAGQLANFRISHVKEIEGAFKSALATRSPVDVEIWLCQSVIEIGGTNLAGRLTLPSLNSLAPSYIEVVWYASPRLLENINLSTFPYPYLFAVRQPGQLVHRVKILHIPSKYRSPNRAVSARFLENFRWLEAQVASHKDKIATVELMLQAAGANEVSLEFKSDNGCFRFIDWDTEVEIAEHIKTE
jgi:hypothetical protein